MVFKPIKCILRPTVLFTNKVKWAFSATLVYIALFFYDVNITILPLDRPISAEFTKGFSMKELYLFKITIIILKNYSTNTRSVSTNDQMNSKTNHLINN